MRDPDMSSVLFRYIKIAVVVVLSTVLLGIPGCMFGWPMYKVWERGKAGEAELSQAEYNRKIAVQEAQAKMDSAKMLASAEVEKARGVAEANKIIGDSLKGNEEYLRYLWIDKLGNSSSETIYIPTEAGLPILEATRRK